MKAVQQLLFDVDWTSSNGEAPLDALVIDMPPGTGDIQISLGQLVSVDGMSLPSSPWFIESAERKLMALGAVIVSTPQDVALVDARKGVAMFKKVDIPVCDLSNRGYSRAEAAQIIGLLLNMSHYTCTSCSVPHELFGSSASFERAASDLQLDVLGKIPLVTQVSDGGDAGRPVMVQSGKEGGEVRETMKSVGEGVWEWLGSRKTDSGQVVGTRG